MSDALARLEAEWGVDEAMVEEHRADLLCVLDAVPASFARKVIRMDGALFDQTASCALRELADEARTLLP